MAVSEEQYNQAVYMMKNGDNGGARNILQQILKSNPKDERAWMLYVKTLSTTAERIQALKWCLKINPESDIARETLEYLQQPSPAPKIDHVVPTRIEAGIANRGSGNNKTKSTIITPLVITGIIIVACIVFFSLQNILDTPLLAVFGIGGKYQASAYEITDPVISALVIENHSPFFINSVILTRHQDGKVYEFEGITVEGSEVFAIEPGGYDLTTYYSDLTPETMFTAGEMGFYVDGIATAHFNVRKKRAVIFHLEGGGITGMLSYEPSELVGK
ncbi:MAG: tetratricopeptide repeat protein [Anaerolineales bacterium]|nr:tetratricopeptide repeat protein [Anaerolineales bacterium]